jgi:uncharacterized protein with NAD-binding domain and iron-sulfur cluster
MTNDQGWQDRYDITLYQMGWRLGGKAACGRNARLGQRIEEHGLHVMMGFYENLFRMMRSVFTECHQRNLMPGSPFQDWTDAFKPHDLVSNMEFVEGRGWIPWSTQYPRNDRFPGDTAENTKAPTPWDYVLMGLAWLIERYDEAWQHTPPDQPVQNRLPVWTQAILELLDLSEAVASEFKSLLHLALEFAQTIGRDLEKIPALHLKALVAIVDEFLAEIRKASETERNDTLRRLMIQLDIGGALIRGMIEDDTINLGFDSLEDQDLAEWLAKHGCRQAFEGSIKSFYDGSFAYVDGDPTRPRLAAGTALRGLCRILLTYGHSIFWLMQSGMGDTIAAPLYLLLKERGVKFRFFHRVSNLALSNDGAQISAIDLDVQATTLHGDYNPLFRTPDGLYCWPAEPFYDQLNDAGILKGHNPESAWCASPVTPARLERGVDFDQILFGISIGSVPFVCRELLAVNARWRDMVENILTIQTQSVQLWMNRTPSETGWNPWSDGRSAAGAEPAQASSYLEPYDSWGDMSHLLARECWPPEANVQQLTYLVNTMPAVRVPPVNDPSYPASEQARVRDNALHFLSTAIQPWFPKAALPTDPNALDWNCLVDIDGGAGAARLDAQFIKVNIDPSERYVLSVPGSSKFRLHAGDTGFGNLFVCGDWIYTWLNGGCAESAVIGGLFASVAICGKPDFILDAFGIPEPPSAFTPRHTAAAG